MKPRVEGIVLFCSLARGDAKPDSDYDIAADYLTKARATLADAKTNCIVAPAPCRRARGIPCNILTYAVSGRA
ncbi:MAG: nucleotidyltransferase domain-containing protein [Acetobacteraceae bacterium]